MRANISKNDGAVYYIHINTEQQVKSIVSKSSDTRPVFSKLDEIDSDEVWCVEVDTGAIITRRNGKVSILGNCQMAGRGMRPKSHTDHCLVLDFAGVVTRHGPITFVQAEDGPSDKKKDDEDDDEEAPSKSCPMCKEINSIRAKECAECGELFPVIEKKILSLHSSTDIMGLKPNVMPVSSWAWSVHTSKKTGVDMIKITYYSPVLSDPLVSEYLCLLHDGYAQKKALGVLRSLCDGSGTAPDNETLDSLCYQFNNVKPPGELHYIKAGKFYKIVSHDFSIEPTHSNLLEMLF